VDMRRLKGIFSSVYHELKLPFKSHCRHSYNGIIWQRYVS
jgi:hypothetical protein